MVNLIARELIAVTTINNTIHLEMGKQWFGVMYADFNIDQVIFKASTKLALKVATESSTLKATHAFLTWLNGITNPHSAHSNIRENRVNIFLYS